MLMRYFLLGVGAGLLLLLAGGTLALLLLERQPVPVVKKGEPPAKVEEPEPEPEVEVVALGPQILIQRLRRPDGVVVVRQKTTVADVLFIGDRSVINTYGEQWPRAALKLNPKKK
jgi:hypothetical protein